LHLHHTGRELLDQHTWAHLEPEISQSNSRAAIIAPRAMQWEGFFYNSADIFIDPSFMLAPASQFREILSRAVSTNRTRPGS